MVAALERIEVNGVDKTDELQKYLQEISFRDEDGSQSDELTLTFAGTFARPRYDDEIRLWLKDKKERFFCGAFKVQTSERDRVSTVVTATGADFSMALKQKRSMAYEKVSLQHVAKMVANRHGLKLKSDFEDLYVTHLAQSDESDMHFMKRLADEYNAIFSVKNGTLVFMRRTKGGGRSDDLPVFEVSAAECGTCSVKHSNKTLYGSCKVQWHDTKENALQEQVVGSGEPVLVMEGAFKSPAEAIAKAKARLELANRGVKKGAISMAGKTIYAGGTLKLSGAEEDDGEYTINSVSHTVGNGWVMDVDFES